MSNEKKSAVEEPKCNYCGGEYQQHYGREAPACYFCNTCFVEYINDHKSFEKKHADKIKSSVAPNEASNEENEWSLSDKTVAVNYLIKAYPNVSMTIMNEALLILELAQKKNEK